MELDQPSDGSADSGSDIEEYKERAFDKLKSGKATVRNSDGTLRCPFCVGKKKQDYKYADLLQHANGVSQGRRGAEAAGCHTALVRFLKENQNFAEPPKLRVEFLEQKTPQRKNIEELLVWPWMGVIVNIDNNKINDGKRVGPGNNEIKSRFSQFKPKSVHVFWGREGHTGMAAIEFHHDMVGYSDAQEFEKSFLEVGKCKRDWELKRRHPSELGRDLYGWIARQQDFESNDIIGKYLRQKGSLRTVADVNEGSARKQDQLVQNLHKELQDFKGQVLDLQTLVSNAETARRQAESEKREMEERHKQELRAMEKEHQKAIQRHDEKLQKERMQLDRKMKILQQQCHDFKKHEMQTEVERKKQEMERDQKEKTLQRFRKLAELYQKQEIDQINLIKKHEEENKKLAHELHNQKKKLANQHKLELEIQNLEALIATKKLNDDANVEESKGIKKMEEELNDMKEEMEGLQDMHTQLTYKERQLNDELQDGTKEAIRVLKKHGNTCSIGVKRMGELNNQPWAVSCKRKYMNDEQGWGYHHATIFSEWEEYLRDGSWNPFKTICVGEDKWEKQIDEKDEKLSKLRDDLGEDVYKSVVVALNELEDYNPSGRYPVAAAWNFKENRRATMKEVINYLDGLLIKNTARKRKKT